ncbi:hypothetical protein EDB80DRAFT_291935 [Ilyonectria destructans]|nr:hypothetical protein EDB80DRAFT_291935 [Ilyonectria destructans]
MEDNDEKSSAPAKLGQVLLDAFASKSSVSPKNAHATLASASAGTLPEEDIIPHKDGTPALAMSDSVTGIFQSVSKFISSMQPYQFMLPPDLRLEMISLQKEVDKSCPKETNSNPWTCEIQVLTMDDWKQGIRGSGEKPVPVLQVYYQRLSRAMSLEALTGDPSQVPHDMALDMIRDQKNLQRILINSDILHAELEFITSTTIPFPVM